MTCAISHLKWASTGAQVIGVFCLSGRLTEPPTAFAVMTVGALGWVAAAWFVREWSIVALNLTFTASNMLGIWRWLA